MNILNACRLTTTTTLHIGAQRNVDIVVRGNHTVINLPHHSRRTTSTLTVVEPTKKLIGITVIAYTCIGSFLTNKVIYSSIGNRDINVIDWGVKMGTVLAIWACLLPVLVYITSTSRQISRSSYVYISAASPLPHRCSHGH